MRVNLEIDTDAPISHRDRCVLLALAGTEMASLVRGEEPQARGYVDQDEEPRPTGTGGAPAVEPTPDTSEPVTPASDATPAKKGRSRKAAAEAQPASSDTTPSPAPTADPFAIKPQPAAAPGLAGDVFSTQIKEANAEAAAEEAQNPVAEAAQALANDHPAFTVKDVNDAAAAAMERCRGKGVSGAKEIKAALADFKTAAGAGVDRLADLQPGDWGSAIEKMNGIAA